ncbi:hypothetical protein DFH27DRAFT_514922 [Peziza echinospora]|nr:hypothetical protein DFH27DRAFT_514922 [Peziza echinospora]
MLFSFNTLAALAAFAPLVAAHVKMVGPESFYSIPEGKEQNPLDANGANYPCFYTSGGSGKQITWDAGTRREINLRGSAVHGGGSCQVSIAYPKGGLNAGTVFKVLQSYEGACPAGSTTGNLPDDIEHVIPALSFNLPKDIPSGDAVIAWTWFNKIGNREMYMRCAPVKIAGGASDETAFNALPDMFKANIGNQCTVPEGGDLKFPNPGRNLIGSGSIIPVGSGCQKAGALPNLPTLPVPAPTTTKPVLVPVPTTTVAPSYTAPAPTKPATTITTTTIQVIPQKPTSTSTVAVPTVIPVPPKDAPKPSPPAGGACVDGQIICTSATTWAMCNFGVPVPMGTTAAGLECQDGRMVLAKRTVRFSDAHRRRHHTN